MNSHSYLFNQNTSRLFYLFTLAALLFVPGLGCGTGVKQAALPDTRGADVEVTNAPADDIAEDAMEDTTEGRSAGIKKRGGIHTLALARWSGTSVKHLGEVLTEKNMPANVEFSFVPFWSSQPYAKAKDLIKRLTDAHKKVRVTVYLDFQGTIAHKQAIVDRAAQFQTDFLAEYAANSSVSINLSPCLEDGLTSESQFLEIVRDMVRELDWTMLNRLQLRWNSMKHKPTGTPTFNISVKPGPKQIAQKARIFKVQTEYHGPFNSMSSFYAYSNDGVFVYLDKPANGAIPENEGSAHNSDAFTNTHKPSLTEWISNINASQSKSVIMLWRPAYNLWPKTTPNGIAYYEKAGNVTDRNDSDDAPAFGNSEMEVVRQFLRTK